MPSGPYWLRLHGLVHLDGGLSGGCGGAGGGFGAGGGWNPGSQNTMNLPGLYTFSCCFSFPAPPHPPATEGHLTS